MFGFAGAQPEIPRAGMPANLPFDPLGG